MIQELKEIRKKMEVELRHLRATNNSAALNITNIIADLTDVIDAQKTSSNSDYAKYEMYQCHYEKACHCKMDEPCKGCETWAKYFAIKEHYENNR